MLYKYPKTLHLPFSPGVQNDDKVIEDLSVFDEMSVVVTEKYDGENTTFYNNHIHARSLDSKHHASRDWVKALHGAIKHHIPEGWRICGENMYAKHSILYKNLKSYFYVFSIWNEYNVCLDWNLTHEYCHILGLCLVPELWTGTFNIDVLKNIAVNLNAETQEGFVVRNANSFSYEDFQRNIVKYVRKGHVQTEDHWMTQQIVPNILESV